VRRITDENSSRASRSEFCDALSAGINGTYPACNNQLLRTISAGATDHPVLYYFVVAQLLIGFGGCGMFVLTLPYIYDNAERAKSALYIGKIVQTSNSFMQRLQLLLDFDSTAIRLLIKGH